MQNLLPFATDRQKEYINAVIEHGSGGKAAKALGVAKSVINSAIASLKNRAAKQGYSPEHGMTRTVPDGFTASRVSTNYKEDGSIGQQWVIATPDKERQDEIRNALLRTFCDDFRGLAPITKAPKQTYSDLLAVYPLGDPHFGMYSWAQECGDDFDTEEAKRLTCGAVDRLVESAPPAETAILVSLGDTFHADDQKNVTPGHGHQLDVDSRYPRVMDIVIKTFRHAAIRMLERHNRLIIRIEPGNHDPHSKWALTYALAAYFENEPRVTVDVSPANRWFYKFGKVLIGTTHGDKIKQSALLGVMAVDKAEDWGATSFRYWYTGHIHHQQVLELSGVVCESFRTLASKDAYASSNGYRAGRDMCCIVHHANYGEIERHRCDVAMLA